jgi:hypothetical protein
MIWKPRATVVQGGEKPSTSIIGWDIQEKGIPVS